VYEFPVFNWRKSSAFLSYPRLGSVRWQLGALKQQRLPYAARIWTCFVDKIFANPLRNETYWCSSTSKNVFLIAKLFSQHICEVCALRHEPTYKKHNRLRRYLECCRQALRKLKTYKGQINRKVNIVKSVTEKHKCPSIFYRDHRESL